MTQVADIITQAYRESNIVDVNASPSPTETTEALARLQAIVLSTLGNEVGYIMQDWNVTQATILRPNGVAITEAVASHTVKPNARLMCNLSGALTLNLDPQPQDGQRFGVVDAGRTFNTFNFTIDPNGRQIEASVANLVLSTQGDARQYLFRSDTGNWHRIEPMLVADAMPFPQDFDDYFVIMLAMRLNPRQGMSIADDSKARLAQQHAQFVARYTQTRLRRVPAPWETPEKQ